MLVPTLKLAERSQVLLLTPVLYGACMEGHQHVDCGKMQLDDVLLSCLEVFFILNGGFLLHHSDVSTTALEAGEVPGACFNSPGSQACPGEIFLMQTPWPHCWRASGLLTPPQSSALTLAGHHQTWAQARQRPQKSTHTSLPPRSFSELSLPTRLALGIYLCTYVLCWTGPRGRRVVPEAESNLPEGFLRPLLDLPGVSLAKPSFT